jgi:hypothetical protein
MIGDLDGQIAMRRVVICERGTIISRCVSSSSSLAGLQIGPSSLFPRQDIFINNSRIF